MAPKKKPGSHTRGYTLLKDQMSHDTSTMNQTRSTPLSQLEIETEIGLITTVQADESLQQFPEQIKDQLIEYLLKPGSMIRTFAGGPKQFDLYTTTTDQPACFVELDTENRLDAAIYHFGPVLRRSMIVVVKPQPNSSFNDGRPAIIAFYGKGKKADNRHVISRWAIWTPDGYRDDLLVDRLVTGETPEILNPKRAPKKRMTKRKRSTNVSDEEDASERLFMSEDEELEEHEEYKEDTITLMRYPEPNQDPEREINRDYYQPATIESTPMITPNSRLFTLNGAPIRLPQSSSQIFNTVSSRPRQSTGVPQALASPALSNSQVVNIQHSMPNNSLSEVMVYFKAIHTGETYVSKSLMQCNSIQKLFAYAHKAGISGSGVILLSATIGTKSIEVIRDDYDDFQELLQLVHEEQESSPNETIVVTITPCAY